MITSFADLKNGMLNVTVACTLRHKDELLNMQTPGNSTLQRTYIIIIIRIYIRLVAYKNAAFELYSQFTTGKVYCINNIAARDQTHNGKTGLQVVLHKNVLFTQIMNTSQSSYTSVSNISKQNGSFVNVIGCCVVCSSQRI